MQTYANIKQNTSQAEPAENHSGGGPAFQLQDNRPQSIIQKKQADALANRQVSGNLIQKKANNTGLPDQLKTGVENLSGHSMDDVKVHYNSDKPAQLNAHAYAQGSDIHLAAGQEKHLSHEAWHVVQQKQGRVKPTLQMKSKVNINDDAGLEKEADVMGNKARSFSGQLKAVNHTKSISTAPVQRFVIIGGKEIDASKIQELVAEVIQWANGHEEYKVRAVKRKQQMTAVLTKWVGSQPLRVGKTMVGNPAHDAAYWKDFKTFAQFAMHLIEEANPIVDFNRLVEQQLAQRILLDPGIAHVLNLYRQELSVVLLSKDNIIATSFSKLTSSIVPNLQGSYNWAGTNLLSLSSLSVKPNHTEMLTSKKSFSSGKNISVLHDITELFSSRNGGRILPTFHSTLIPEPFTTAASNSTKLTGDNRIEESETDKSGHGFDRGKLNIGTRDEASSDTKAARKLGFPVEAGRSHTTARMMEQANLVKADKRQKTAISTALFAYWNATSHHGGYPKGLTPVHTLHETMDVAKNYGVRYKPVIVSEIMKQGQKILVGLGLLKHIMAKYPNFKTLPAKHKQALLLNLAKFVFQIFQSEGLSENAVNMAMKYLPREVIAMVGKLTASAVYRELRKDL